MMNNSEAPWTRVPAAHPAVRPYKNLNSHLHKAANSAYAPPVAETKATGFSSPNDIGGCSAALADFFVRHALLRLINGGPCGGAARLAGSYVPVC